MPKFLVTQNRDAMKYWLAVIEADSPEEAKRKAEDDECEWVDGGCDQFDDRDIPLDEIEECDDDYVIGPHTVKGKVWVLRVDTNWNGCSHDVYANEKIAQQALWDVLECYLSIEEREQFSGLRRGTAAYDYLMAKHNGELPNGDVVCMEEHEIELEVASV